MKPKALFSPLDRRKLIDLKGLAKQTGIPLETLRVAAEEGKLPARRLGPGRKWWFRRSELEQWWTSTLNPLTETNHGSGS